MIRPFHLSFVVPDLDAARSFYVDVLGCRLGRDKGRWLDILFFGHQITVHQQNENRPAVPVDHFGPVLEKTEWLTVAENCRAKNVEFVTPPQVTGESTEAEAGKFVIRDPAGNLLEFKFYRDFDNTVGK